MSHMTGDRTENDRLNELERRLEDLCGLVAAQAQVIDGLTARSVGSNTIPAAPPPARATDTLAALGRPSGVSSTLRSAAGASAVETTEPRMLGRRGLLLGVTGSAAAAAIVFAAPTSSAAADSVPISTGGIFTSTAPTTIWLNGNSGIGGPDAALVGQAIGTGAYGIGGTSVDSVAVYGESHGDFGVWGRSITSPGVRGDTFAPNGEGVHGYGATGVAGVGDATGVDGSAYLVTASHGYTGVRGSLSTEQVSGSSYGGAATSSNAAVRGEAGVYGNGVVGTSTRNVGVHGTSGSVTPFTATAGVIGESSTNYGTAGFSTGKAGVRAASNTAEGIKATSTSGVGGAFTGGRAAINLSPTGNIGRPLSGVHSTGDLVVDNSGRLFLCTKSGTPGGWVKVTVTAA